MKKTVTVNPFVTRQTKESQFSHYEGTFEEVAEMAFCKLESMTEEELKPVMVLRVGSQGFFSGVAELKEGCELHAEFAPRRKGEDPYVQVTVSGLEKLPAKHVELVIYSHEALEGDASSESDYELVSINARCTEEEEPPTPVAMARNFLEREGGTKQEYTAEEFARAIEYWSTRAMIAPPQ